MEEATAGTSANFTPLAIIGIGCLFPKADDLSSYWANIKDGIDAITEIPQTHWRIADYFDQDPKSPDMTYGKRGGFLSPIQFNPIEYNLPPNTLEAIDTSQLLGLVAAGQALKDAGYGPGKDFDRNRTSVILGVTGALELVIPLGARLGHPAWRSALKNAGVADDVAEDVIQRIADSYVPWQENSFPGLLGNVVAGRISKQFDLGGTNCVVDAACASSFSALHLAGMELATGKADMVVTGGIDTFNSIFMYMCFSKTPALSPSGDAKPFDASGDGTILGEGLGVLVIKRLCDAERDGDKIYAVIRGIGSSSDGKGEAIYAPSATGQKKALIDAYGQAGISPSSISMIEAHGTGTKVGDAVEVTALRELFGEAESPWCALGSVKSQIGHTKAAAGAAGLIKAALALHHKVVPPTVKVSKPLEEVTSGKTPFYIAAEKKPWLRSGPEPRRAGVSAFGFGGSNFHVVLEEYGRQKESIDWDGNVQIIGFSSADHSEIQSALDSIPVNATWNELRIFAASTRGSFNHSAPCRLILVVEREKTNLASLVKKAAGLLKEKPIDSWNTPDGAYYSFGIRDGKLGFLFPGQGSQYTGMMRDLACEFPEMLDALSTADTGFKAATAKRLSDKIYPSTPFSPEEKESQESALRATEVAQPAIGSISLGLHRILAQFGLDADAVAGHSYGELTALCTAGILDEDAFHGLSRLRGQLMGNGQGDRGGMLAVAAPLEQIDQLIAQEKLELVVANRNAPNQAVLSGRSDEIARCEDLLSPRAITCKRLPVAAAFHSRLVADAAAPFLEALNGIDFKPALIPVYADTTGNIYPTEAAEQRALLAYQLANPVDFVGVIEKMYMDGVRTFVEVGPGARLAGLVKAILGEREHAVLSIDSSSGKRPGMVDLARALAQLASLGHPAKLSLWDQNFSQIGDQAKKPALSIPICGANYVKPRAERPPVATAKEKTPPAPLPSTEPLPVRQQQTMVVQPATTVPRNSLGETLGMTRESISMLLKMQEETAKLHRLFLEGQERAAKTFQLLLDQQRPVQATVLPSPSDPNRIDLSSAIEDDSAIEAEQVQQQQVAHDNRQLFDSLPVLMEVISEKTGYPVDMLEPDMALDSDLGIDSIKRVEILSAIREKLPDAPVIGPEHIGQLRTLAEIARHLGSGGPRPEAPTAAVTVISTLPVKTPATREVMQTLLAVVSEKTGYPVDMLEPDMALDSDLGIDSIKRVEILSTIRERLPDAPAIGPEHMGQLRTLAEIAAHLDSGAQLLETSSAGTPHTVTVRAAADILKTLLGVVSEKTGYPVEMLEPDMALDSDLGIDSIKRVEILSTIRERLPDAPAIGPEHMGQLRTLAEISTHLGSADSHPVIEKSTQSHVNDETSSKAAPVVRSRLATVPIEMMQTNAEIVLEEGSELWVIGDGSPLSEYLCAFLTDRGFRPRNVQPSDALDLPAPTMLTGLVILPPSLGTDDRFIENAFLILKNTGSALRNAAASGAALFVTVSRLDGSFGSGANPSLRDPLSGALAGLSKTVAREWPEVHCKAIDLGEFPDHETAATSLGAEILRNGPIEVGLTPSGRSSLQLVEMSQADPPGIPVIGEGDVVVMTGGGRGVTAATAVTLTKTFRPFLVLLGRSPAPAPEPAWLNGLDDESAIKRAIMENAGEKLHPRDIEQRFRGVMTGRELRTTLDRIASSGGRAIYRSVDIRDAAQVTGILDEIRSEHGPIRGVIHGAGILADRLIADKSSEQFSMVYSTKVDGLRSLLDATRHDDLRFIVLFSSVTGRFGRVGQIDYSVANEAINKLAVCEAALRPGCRTVSINWGPWDGGMVTAALKKVFASEGVGLIGLEAGGDFLIREISADGGPVEIVAVAGSADQQKVSLQPAKSVPMEEAVALNLTIDGYPFLRSHVLDGKAVLPMAVIVEWLAHGALHGNPGFRFHGFNDLRICKGVVFDEDTSCSLRVMAGKAVKRDKFHLIPVELTSIGKDNRAIIHARAEIVLSGKLPEGIRSITEIPSTPYHPRNGELYDRERLFHGPELHGIEQVTGCSEAGIAAMVRVAPPPPTWIRKPFRSSWITDPLVIDSAFQMMILWSFERFGAGSLPCFAGRYRQFAETFPRDGVQVVVRITAERENSAHADMEFLEVGSGKLVARLEDYECVIDPSLKQAFRRNKLAQSGPQQMGAA
jgi:acyl transferase domain-containing protein/acyl carrier protein/NAD(P)-dependent dehydrogenase (short-subunit alcohol dehydrogenase family)